MQKYENAVGNVAIDRKKIAQTLRQLEPGKPELFPFIQLDSVYTGIQRLQKKHKAQGWRWSTRTTESHIEVTRES